MASIRLREKRDGSRFYEIRVSRGRNLPYVSKCWDIPAGWSQRAIDREVKRIAGEFEAATKNGEVLTKPEQKTLEAARKAEEDKILTFEQFAERVYVPTLEIKSENCRSNFCQNLKNHIYPKLGAYKLTEITSPMISALLLDMQKAGYKVATVVKVYLIISLVFKTAYDAYAVTINPMDRVKRPRPTKAEGKRDGVEAFSIDEMRYILQCLENEPLKWRALVGLMIDTGCRRGEICGLRWKSVDFTAGTITIENNLCYTPDKGVYDDTPKSGKSRTIAIDSRLIAMLKELQRDQKLLRLALGPEAGEDLGYVFIREDCFLPIHPQSPTRYLQKFGERYGIKDVHPHKFRHSFASIAITQGADVASVSEKLGHADKAITLRMYTHADQESINRASNIFRNALREGAEN